MMLFKIIRILVPCRQGLLLALLTVLCFAQNPAYAENIPFFLPFPKIDTNRWYISDGWANGEHQSCEWRPDALQGVEGNLKLTLSDKGGKVRPIGCAELHTNKQYGYGVFEARLRTASGSGLNTAFFTYIGPPAQGRQDEIDFEFLGKDSHTVQLNYFTNGKGQHEKIIDLGFDAAAGFHNYSIDWEPMKIRWYVDGKKVYETPDGADIPFSPGNMFFSLWSGSGVEDAWLGHFTYQAPVSAEVAWVKYTPLPSQPK